MLTSTQCVYLVWDVNYWGNIVFRLWNADLFYNMVAADTHIESNAVLAELWHLKSRLKDETRQKLHTVAGNDGRWHRKRRQRRLLTFIRERQKQWTYRGWCIFGKQRTDVWNRPKTDLCLPQPTTRDCAHDLTLRKRWCRSQGTGLRLEQNSTFHQGLDERLNHSG